MTENVPLTSVEIRARLAALEAKHETPDPVTAFRSAGGRIHETEEFHEWCYLQAAQELMRHD